MKARAHKTPYPDSARQPVHPVEPPTVEYIPAPKDKHRGGRLIWADNLEAMELLTEEGYRGEVKLIYMDPPFLTDASYHRKIRLKKGLTLKDVAYPDRGDMDSYLKMLRARLLKAKELLREDGLLFVHCDWRANSYIRVLLDELFGYENFLNEIIWHYGGRGAKHTSSQFPRNHDTIYAYRKGRAGRLKKLYLERLIPVEKALSLGYRMDSDGRLFKTAPRGDYTDESIRRLATEGRVYITRNGNVRIKYFLEVRSGHVVERPLLGDVWTDIPDAMHTPYEERTGYTTQKPLKLMERIVECATEEGDLVVDPFGGSGTTAVAAQRLGRRWILCEKSSQGVGVTRVRLLAEGALPFVIERLSPWATQSEPSYVKPSVRWAKEGVLSISIKANPEGPALPAGLKPKEAHLLLDYWAVDYHYRPKEFRACWLSFREERAKGVKAVEMETSVVIKDRVDRIAIRLVDVFGRDFTYTINPKEL